MFRVFIAAADPPSAWNERYAMEADTCLAALLIISIPLKTLTDRMTVSARKEKELIGRVWESLLGRAEANAQPSFPMKQTTRPDAPRKASHQNPLYCCTTRSHVFSSSRLPWASLKRS